MSELTPEQLYAFAGAYGFAVGLLTGITATLIARRNVSLTK